MMHPTRLIRTSSMAAVLLSAVLAFVVALVAYACPARAYADDAALSDAAPSDAALGDSGSDDAASIDAALNDIRIWHSVNLRPNSVYNVSQASTNTTVFIREPGNYRLTGSSTKVRVVVGGDDVRLYLQDVTIDPGALAYSGASTAGIIIEDKYPRTVTIVSRGNSYIGGYREAAAIQKNGVGTHLVFETEDPNYPGTITADRSSGNYTPGIGCTTNYDYPIGPQTGAITFNSGNIVAKGGYGAAGIGGPGGETYVTDIAINGGVIRATGGGSAAGIGAGMNGDVNLTVNGGSVLAVSEGEMGIGIGAPGTNARLYASINGGEVVARGGYNGVGIGTTLGRMYLEILGGRVAAQATGPESYGIGGGGGSANNVHCEIFISGGTVRASGGRVDIGNNGARISSVVISGGSVKCDRITDGPLDKSDRKLYKTTVNVEGANSNFRVSEVAVWGRGTGLVNYGVNDMIPSEEGSLYLWIPANFEIHELWDGQRRYYRGNAYAGKTGEFKRATTLSLIGDSEIQLSSGHGFATVGSTRVDIEQKPTAEAGFKLVGYASHQLANGGWAMVVNADGSLIGSRTTEDGQPITDIDGRWIYDGSTIDLIAVWREESPSVGQDPDNSAGQSNPDNSAGQGNPGSTADQGDPAKQNASAGQSNNVKSALSKTGDNLLTIVIPLGVVVVLAAGIALGILRSRRIR